MRHGFPLADGVHDSAVESREGNGSFESEAIFQIIKLIYPEKIKETRKPRGGSKINRVNRLNNYFEDKNLTDLVVEKHRKSDTI